MNCRFGFRLAVIGLFCLGTAAAQVSYNVTDLGTLSGGTFSCAMGLNNHGWTELMDTLVDSSGNTLLRASVRIAGVKVDLGTLGGSNSFINWGGINERGNAVGFAETANPDPNGEDFCFFGTGLTCRPFIWQNGDMSALPTLGGNNGQASAINSRGQVVGAAETANTESGCSFHAAPPVLWTKGVAQELPMVQGDTDGFAFGINNSGEAVGGTGACTSINHAASWQNGIVQELPSLGGAFNNMAFAVNSTAEIAGVSDLAGDATFHATIWQNGTVTDLGTIAGDFASFATGLNDKGQVVGTSFDASFSPAHGFIWQNGVMTDISTLFPAGFYLFPTMANKINASGQISGMATDLNDGTIHAFLATPVHSGESAAVRSGTAAAPRVKLPDSARQVLLRGLSAGNRTQK